MRTFVSCVPDEHPKQPANVESLLGFSGDVFYWYSVSKKKKKSTAALLAKNAWVARMCYFILGTSAASGVAPPLWGLLI